MTTPTRIPPHPARPNRKPNAPPPGRPPGLVGLACAGLRNLFCTGQLVGTPRQVSLRLVDWYRREVSNGRRCRTARRAGAHVSCSAYGRRVLARYGFVLGWTLALSRMVWCSVSNFPDDSDGDCLDRLADCLFPCGR